MIVLHNNKKGNNYTVANIIKEHFNCESMAAEDNPDINAENDIVIILSNTGDEELQQPMEDYLYNLKTKNKRYYICELGNYFGLDSYMGCKKIAIKILDKLEWEKISDISLDSFPKLDFNSLNNWIHSL